MVKEYVARYYPSLLKAAGAAYARTPPATAKPPRQSPAWNPQVREMEADDPFSREQVKRRGGSLRGGDLTAAPGAVALTAPLSSGPPPVPRSTCGGDLPPACATRFRVSSSAAWRPRAPCGALPPALATRRRVSVLAAGGPPVRCAAPFRRFSLPAAGSLRLPMQDRVLSVASCRS
ncbi:hypothetical protein [Methanoculleus chikugoensis]|uniref:hypothetical protein n=1 Tax=Methanoculleus chikugoensis TaxID=118126 RepID=UPI001FB503E9|nr:hypothetical protein [Methanoculleus chikugoensis]